MGIDVYATVFYGIPLDINKIPDWWEDDDDGIEEGWKATYLHKSELEDVWSNRRAIPVDVSWGCAEGCEEYYAYLDASKLGSDWGELTELSLEAKSEWDEQLKDWCEKVDIEYQQPKWYLTCRMS